MGVIVIVIVQSGMKVMCWGRDNIAIDDKGIRLPFVTVLSLYGGIVENYFEIKKHSCWKLSVLVFDRDEEMIDWLGKNKCCDAIFVV